MRTHTHTKRPNAKRPASACSPDRRRRPSSSAEKTACVRLSPLPRCVIVLCFFFCAVFRRAFLASPPLLAFAPRLVHPSSVTALPPSPRRGGAEGTPSSAPLPLVGLRYVRACVRSRTSVYARRCMHMHNYTYADACAFGQRSLFLLPLPFTCPSSLPLYVRVCGTPASLLPTRCLVRATRPLHTRKRAGTPIPT